MSWMAAFVGSQRFLLFAYNDPSAGPSGKGVEIAGELPTPQEVQGAVQAPTTTVRLSGVPTSPLPAEWVAHLGLPAEPGWMQFLSQPPAGPWRTNPVLRGRFHPEHPDDIEANFLQLRQRTIERMWGQLHAPIEDLGFVGKLLNSSQLVPDLASGVDVLVRPSTSHPPLVFVPVVAAENLRDWSSTCGVCGFELVLIPMQELIRMQFPNAPPNSLPERFTTRCAMCESAMQVVRRS